jgi:LPS O-antigen subunit length determinant protein (WzzB/FepE family)
MSKYHNVNNDDEIDLREFFLTLWFGKIYIILLVVISIFLASIYLRTLEKEYTVEYKLKSIAESKNSNNFAGLSGFSSFTGIQLPSNSNNDFKIFKELLTSVEVAKVIFNNEELIKEIYSSEWNNNLNSYAGPSLSKTQILINDMKKLIIGSNKINYIPPNPKRLSMLFSQSVTISEDGETGFLVLSSETSNPEQIISLIIEATEASDDIMRQRYIEFSSEPLAFYKEKLRTARAREHREALAELIGAEEQKLMFASRGKYFIAKPFISPTISLYPTAPRPRIILALSVVLGLIIGTAVALMRQKKMKDN